MTKLSETDYRSNEFEKKQSNNTCPPSPKPLAFMTCPQNTILPNPRLVSDVYCREVNETSNRTNQFFTIFSQFVDHDFTLTLDHGTPSCCQKPNNPTCINVIVPPNDTLRVNGSCLEVITSLTFCEQSGCQNDPFNTNTGFLDCSALYGSTNDFAIQLRALTGGQMKTSAHNLLPLINSNFTGGDERAIEHPGLAVIHTLFLREHNRIAGISKKLFI